MTREFLQSTGWPFSTLQKFLVKYIWPSVAYLLYSDDIERHDASCSIIPFHLGQREPHTMLRRGYQAPPHAPPMMSYKSLTLQSGIGLGGRNLARFIVWNENLRGRNPDGVAKWYTLGGRDLDGFVSVEGNTRGRNQSITWAHRGTKSRPSYCELHNQQSSISTHRTL